GAFNALLLLALIAVWLPACAFALETMKLLPFEGSDLWQLPIWNIGPGIVGLACWPPMGLLGASLGSWLRQQASRRGQAKRGEAANPESRRLRLRRRTRRPVPADDCTLSATIATAVTERYAYGAE